MDLLACCSISPFAGMSLTARRRRQRPAAASGTSWPRAKQRRSKRQRHSTAQAWCSSRCGWEEACVLVRLSCAAVLHCDAGRHGETHLHQPARLLDYCRVPMGLIQCQPVAMDCRNAPCWAPAPSSLCNSVVPTTPAGERCAGRLSETLYDVCCPEFMNPRRRATCWTPGSPRASGLSPPWAGPPPPPTWTGAPLGAWQGNEVMCSRGWSAW